ncbi:3-oxoacyl-ACP reductase FabG [Saccharophagus sp. K07]|uniref:3-oxoacyl-ACP reductase FabG n=1 Tax=Saccharophagus sp. K07 TaxID=2283636 RepID=UPI001651F91B|nr:3-oxoacyl-ACP reductase FabG [Saccharophagus sp. K07]MBC6906699.1 3-oxoacyl-ACP reductase FabG [Saccharophagus sp. K07]
MTIKRVLVTGATGGIGQACATALAAEGYHVTLHYNSNAAKAEALIAQIEAAGGRASAIRFDVRERETVAEALANEIEAYGAFYGVVCNAGITADNAFPAMPGEDWDRVIHTNLDAFYNVLNPLIMPMIRLRKGGRIVTLSSVSGVIGNRGQVNYSAAKAGIIGATKALALELAKRNITVNCVAPGFIQTEMTSGLIVDEALKMIPMQRVGAPEDVANLVKFLMSDGAAYITRQVIQVNGGMI